MTVKNQCDGCQAGIPVNKRGYHIMGDSKHRNVMVCQRDRYAKSPVERYLTLPPELYGR